MEQKPLLDMEAKLYEWPIPKAKKVLERFSKDFGRFSDAAKKRMGSQVSYAEKWRAHGIKTITDTAKYSIDTCIALLDVVSGCDTWEQLKDKHEEFYRVIDTNLREFGDCRMALKRHYPMIKDWIDG